MNASQLPLEKPTFYNKFCPVTACRKLADQKLQQQKNMYIYVQFFPTVLNILPTDAKLICVSSAKHV